jgi:GGDEF domain-containing protein
MILSGSTTFSIMIRGRLFGLVAVALRPGVQITELVSRFSGDEFVLLLLETGYEGALVCIKTIQIQLSQICTGDSWPVTFRIGAATFLRAPSGSGRRSRPPMI